MSMHQLRTVQDLPVSLDEAWAFFSDPRNLREITPDWLGFEIKTPDLPDEAYPGLIISYTVRPLFNIPVGWVTEITHIEPKRMFVDEQRRGPYAMWHHEHHFEEIPGGVRMRDIVSYVIPGGPLGDLVNVLTVRERVRAIFRYRKSVLEPRFGIYRAPSLDGAAPAGSRPALRAVEG
jgi:ligand-binding SRPBCC domain-containing protein